MVGIVWQLAGEKKAAPVIEELKASAPDPMGARGLGRSGDGLYRTPPNLATFLEDLTPRLQRISLYTACVPLHDGATSQAGLAGIPR